MIVGTLKFHLYLRSCHSLKEKRSVIKSLKERMLNKFNVSCAETDLQDTWHEAELGVAAVGTDTRFVQSVLTEVEKFVQSDRLVEVARAEKEFF